MWIRPRSAAIHTVLPRHHQPLPYPLIHQLVGNLVGGLRTLRRWRGGRRPVSSGFLTDVGRERTYRPPYLATLRHPHRPRRRKSAPRSIQPPRGVAQAPDRPRQVQSLAFAFAPSPPSRGSIRRARTGNDLSASLRRSPPRSPPPGGPSPGRARLAWHET